ncbi:hypothetical protein Y032_0214g2314 [Ancylostoma ceylanicum]|nr:hypothetical protein Y032_0214g2314 [Ancylostoma ceylanicum]
MDPENLRRKPTQYWLKLGSNYDGRKKALTALRTTRAAWAVKIRQAIGRALNDVRQYDEAEAQDELLPGPVGT